LRGGKVIFSRMKISPRIVPPRRVAGTLTGTVRLPPQLSPGDTLALRSLADAKLPPGGTWVISGTVSEPWEATDLRQARAVIDATRSHLEKLRGDSLPLVLEGEGGCEGLAPIAAVLAARGHRFAGEAALRATAAPDGETPAGGEVCVADLSPLQRVRHDVAMGTIRNLKFFFTVADSPPSGIAINEEEDLVTGRAAAAAARRRQAGKQEAWQVSAAAASDIVSWTWSAPGAPGDARPGAPKTVALDAAPIAGGCRFTPREVGDLDIARWARMQQAPKAGPRPSGKPPAQEIHFVTIPSGLRPGDRLSFRYLDEWGDPWLEVAEAPDVEIVASPEIAESSFIESASPYAVAGDQLCVCGAFSAVDAATDFFLGSEPAAVVSLSSRIAWLQTSAAGVGPALVRAQGLRGEAATELLRVRAELDQEHLFTGQSTPLRIVIEGSTAPLPIRISTGTPQIIEIEGGPDQSTETSGGAVNQVLRQVRGLERGAFELGWELRPSRCPCAEPG
jgi:hypothetical protein